MERFGSTIGSEVDLHQPFYHMGNRCSQRDLGPYSHGHHRLRVAHIGGKYLLLPPETPHKEAPKGSNNNPPIVITREMGTKFFYFYLKELIKYMGYIQLTLYGRLFKLAKISNFS